MQKALLTIAMPALLFAGIVSNCTSSDKIKNITSDTLTGISTDKALYAPGDTVRLVLDQPLERATVRYRHGLDIVAEHPLQGQSWNWVAPEDDFKGYLVEIYRPSAKEADTEEILSTIAVDVSSDWVRFPRYGFVATYDASKLEPGVIESEVEFLNRCHINGIQFYDWHMDHHHPLGGTPGNLKESYIDIGNRTIVTEAVKKYIDQFHQRQIKTMFYNLAFGALDNAPEEGVKDEWYSYRDPRHKEKDVFRLPKSFKSSIYFTDPSNPKWQQYIGDRNEEVYESLDFDGYHIDQVGNRGDVYTYDGEPLNLPRAYASFINAMKERHPDKRLVMNAVSSFGSAEIVSTGNVDFAYNEVWNEQDQFEDLLRIIEVNDSASNNTRQSVFAAYMNYDKAGRTTGQMNTPGVLLTDAVIMAIGGDHLELGDHMLSREYFASAPLAMTDTLKEAMVRYYDFMTAYQNLLRGTSTQTRFNPDLTSTDGTLPIIQWPPREDSIVTFAKEADGRQVISLLNFLGIDNMNWRDLEGTRPEPEKVRNLSLTLSGQGKVNRLWVATPDQNGGAPQQLSFTQEGDKIHFIVPSLDYWTMIVVE